MIDLKPFGKTLRADFLDYYKSKCSIQEASLKERSAIWLGVSTDFEGQPSTRMLLDQEQVKELLPYLQAFVEKGYLTSISGPSTSSPETKSESSREPRGPRKGARLASEAIPTRRMRRSRVSHRTKAVGVKA